MTYTYKLSRRLARLRAASGAVLVPVILLLSCSGDQPGEPNSGLPTDPQVSVTPDSVFMAPNQEMQFRAALNDLYSSTVKGSNSRGRGRRSIIALNVVPSALALADGATTSFAATATLSDGSTVEPVVTWSASGGTIDANGKYIAGVVPGNNVVVATAPNGIADTATVVVTENPPAVAEVSLTPSSALLPIGGSRRFVAVGRSGDGTAVGMSPRYVATGGTISTDGLYQAGRSPGSYQVIAMDSANGMADTSAITIDAPADTLVAVLLTPQTVSLTTGKTQQFEVSGSLSNGSTSTVEVAWHASGGTISAGLYTAGQTPGTFLVIATDTTSDLADTSTVMIEAPPAIQSVVVSPAILSVMAGSKQQFTVSGNMSDGSTTAITADWSASGGTISAGLYTAGQTAGTYQVIARVSGGTLADTANVTITAPSPPPPPTDPVTGKTFFLADAESGVVSPPWNGPVFGNYGIVPVSSTEEAKNGSRAYKFEIPPTSAISSSTVMANRPHVSMGGPSGHFMSGYYSFWVYIDSGFDSNAWNSIFGWMTGVSGAPSPISYIGLERWNATTRSASGPLQLVFLLKNCQKGQYVCPNIPGYAAPVGGNYRMTSASPAGIVQFPTKRWVHVSVYYKMAANNGQVAIWQDGVKIMDLTAPSMNTFGGHSIDPLTNAAGDMVLQHFIYGGPEATTRRMYVDDFKVTDFLVHP